MAMPRRLRTPSRWGVRRRSVLSAVVVVGVALITGAAVLLWLLHAALISTVQDGLVGRATDLSSLFAEQGLNEADSTLAETKRGGEFIQVVDRRGNVLASSDPQLQTSPMSTLRPAAGMTESETLSELADLEDPDNYFLVAHGMIIQGKVYVILVTAPVQVQADTVRTVAGFLLVATPLILIIVGLAVWVLVGRSLGSVERIRQQVNVIDNLRLSDRVDVPPTDDEIARLATTMNNMLERLFASDQALRGFFSDASHELRSPLSTLVTSAEIAATDATGQTWVDLQPTILSESTRMQRLVEDLLTLAKADSRVLADHQIEVDLEDVLDGEAQRLRAVTRHRLITNMFPARVMGDPGRLVQVFRNLLDNADRHAVSTISLSSESTETRTRVYVDNDGEVIPSDQRQRVFERFVRLEQSRARDGGGSGLGLAIAAEIVAIHGGTISATESPQGWCRFVVDLPLRSW